MHTKLKPINKKKHLQKQFIILINNVMMKELNSKHKDKKNTFQTFFKKKSYNFWIYILHESDQHQIKAVLISSTKCRSTKQVEKKWKNTYILTSFILRMSQTDILQSSEQVAKSRSSITHILLHLKVWAFGFLHIGL